MRDLRHGKMLVLDENAIRMVVKKSQFYDKPHIFAVGAWQRQMLFAWFLANRGHIILLDFQVQKDTKLRSLRKEMSAKST